MSDVAPPATAVWYDPDAVLVDAMVMLRLSEGDVDEARLASLVAPSAEAIDAYRDGETPIVGPPPPGWAHQAVVHEVVARYRQHGDAADQFVAVPAARGALFGGEPVATLVRPHKVRFGAA